MIQDLVIKEITLHSDNRGFFAEIFKETFGHNIKQVSISEIKPGVIKAFHFHKLQDDYWFLLKGKVKVVLFDNRKKSKTYKKIQVIILENNDNYKNINKSKVISIPKGVFHGYQTMGNNKSLMLYGTSQCYSPNDEFRVDHNDPMIGYNWEGKKEK